MQLGGVMTTRIVSLVGPAARGKSLSSAYDGVKISFVAGTVPMTTASDPPATALPPG